MLSRPPAAFAASIRRSAALSRLGLSPRISCDPLLGDHRGEAVAAQQQDVVGADRIAPRVDLDGGLGAERAGDDRPLRMFGGLLLGELALADELVDERVVLGQPFERRRRGTGTRGCRRRARSRRGCRRGRRRSGSSPSPRGPARRARARRYAVGLAHAVGEPLLGAAVVRQALLERLDGDPRGDLAGLGAAHPVGDDEHRRAGERGVLVVPGAGGRCRSSRWSQRREACGVIAGRRTRESPIRMRSPECSGWGPVSGSSLRYVPFVEPRSSITTTWPWRDDPRVTRGSERVVELNLDVAAAERSAAPSGRRRSRTRVRWRARRAVAARTRPRRCRGRPQRRTCRSRRRRSRRATGALPGLGRRRSFRALRATHSRNR